MCLLVGPGLLEEPGAVPAPGELGGVSRDALEELGSSSRVDLQACSGLLRVQPRDASSPLGSSFDSSTFSSRHAWFPGRPQTLSAFSLETRVWTPLVEHLDPRILKPLAAFNARHAWTPGSSKTHLDPGVRRGLEPARGRERVSHVGRSPRSMEADPLRLDNPDTSHTTHTHPDVLEPRLDLDPGPLALHAPTQPRQHGGSMERCGGAVLVRDGRVRGRVLFGRGTI